MKKGPVFKFDTILHFSAEGFTIIELLVTLTIMGVLLGTTLVQYNTYNDRQQVKQAALTIMSDLHQVRSEAVSGKKPQVAGCSDVEPFNGYSVSFTYNSYTVSPRCNDVDVVEGQVTHVLPSGVTFSSVPSPASFMYYSLTRGVSAVPDQIILTNQNYSLTLFVDSTSGTISMSDSTGSADPSGAPVCTSFTSMKINECGPVSVWATSPLPEVCKTVSRYVTLNFSSADATFMALYELTEDPTTTICSAIPDASFSSAIAYSSTYPWTLTAGDGQKKVCVQLFNAFGSSKCGAIIEKVSN